MKTIKYLALIVLVFGSIIVNAQEDAKKEKGSPVDETFSGTQLFDNQTVMSAWKGRPELNIQHRFTGMNNGISDLFGLYGGATIRLAMGYGVTEKIMIGFGYSSEKLLDASIKVALLQQTDNNSTPVSVSYYGNMIFRMNKQDTISNYFGDNYAFTNRMIFFNQIIVARKFCDRFSAQVAPSYSHYNWLNSDSTYSHSYIGVHAGAKFNVRGSINALVEYDQPIALGSPAEESKSKPNLALGLEFATGTHGLQLFVCSAKHMLNAPNYVDNDRDFTNFDKEDGITGLALGLNVNVRF